MTALDLDAVEALLDEITPGTWGVAMGDTIATNVVQSGAGSWRIDHTIARLDDYDYEDDGRGVDGLELDAEFIASSPATIRSLIARVRELEATVARVEALIELDGGAFLKPNTKIKRVQEDRRHDLGAIVTTSMVTVQDIRAALSEPTS